MGQGLGRNSPVQLSLGRENYEALIERHGQWIRWRVANKCACVNPNTLLSSQQIKDEYASVALWEGCGLNDRNGIPNGCLHPFCRGGWYRAYPKFGGK